MLKITNVLYNSFVLFLQTSYSSMTFNISKLGLVRKNQLITANIYIYNLKKYRSLYFASWHFVSLRSVVFSRWTPRFEGRKTSVSNLLLFQWASKPTLNAVTFSCFAAALDSTTLRQRECKKRTPPPTTTTTTKQKKIPLISKTTILLEHHTFFVHFMAVLHAVTTSWKRLISRFGRA